MLMDFEYLEHTADAKFRAFGKNIEEAFVNAARATFGILIDTAKVEPKLTKKISIQSKSIESLLYDFLEEMLFALDVDGFLLSGVEEMKITEQSGMHMLECVAHGDSFKNYEISGNIKSITYNDMNIEKNDDGYALTVVVDI